MEMTGPCTRGTTWGARSQRASNVTPINSPNARVIVLLEGFRVLLFLPDSRSGEPCEGRQGRRTSRVTFLTFLFWLTLAGDTARSYLVPLAKAESLWVTESGA